MDLGVIGLEDDLVFDEPGGVPGGTVTVRRYRPFRVGVSLGAIETSIFSGLRSNLKLVGRPSRTSMVNWPVPPCLPLIATIRRIEGIRLIGPAAEPASIKLVPGLVGMVGLDDHLFPECPQGHAGLELDLDPVSPFRLDLLESPGE